jgi:hypothetical protein
MTAAARHARIERLRRRAAGHERRRDELRAQAQAQAALVSHVRLAGRRDDGVGCECRRDVLLAEAKVEAFFATLIRGRLAALERDDEPDASGAL